MTETPKPEQPQQDIDITKFVSQEATEQAQQEQQAQASPPPMPDFDESAFAEMVANIAASVIAKDIPSEAWAALPPPKYLVQFYKLIQLKKASGYLTGAINPDPKTILIIAGVGTAAYIGWMGLTAAKIRKQLGLAGKRQAGEERRREWEEAAEEIRRAEEDARKAAEQEQKPE